MLSDSLLKPWRVFSFKHSKSFLVHASKYMISEDHALILYGLTGEKSSRATFVPSAWDIIVRADSLGSWEEIYRLEHTRKETDE